jgi:putative transposase
MSSGLIDEQHTRTSVSALAYHLVWATKYRRPVLVGEVAAAAQRMLAEIVKAMNGRLVAAEVMPDHVHLFVVLPVTLPLPTLMQRLRGVSARRLFQEYPGIKRRLWNGHLWNPSYWASTVGNVSAAGVARYIAQQHG